MSKSNTKDLSGNKRRRLRKDAFDMRMQRDMRPSMNDDASYLNLAITAGILFSDISTQILENLQTGFLSGRISTLMVMAPGKFSNPDNRNNLKNMLEEKGHLWIWQHVIFPMDKEDARTFILRAIDSYEITHYLDTNKQFLGFLLFSPKHTKLKLHHLKLSEDGWKDVAAWFKVTCPRYWRLWDMDDDSFHLIKTGYAADEKEENQTAQSWA